MHVTSNPFFAFHDDIFPAFAKNMVSQRPYSLSANSNPPSYAKTIIPDNPFSFLDEFEHISTFEMRFYETEIFALKIRQRNETATSFVDICNIEFENEMSFLRLRVSAEDSLVLQSDFNMTDLTVVKNFSLQSEWTAVQVSLKNSENDARQMEIKKDRWRFIIKIKSITSFTA